MRICDRPSSLEHLITITAAFMGSVAGIMCSQYYLILNKKLNIHELYNGHGIYRYWHGVNWRAYVAFVVGVGPL